MKKALAVSVAVIMAALLACNFKCEHLSCHVIVFAFYSVAVYFAIYGYWKLLRDIYKII